MHSLTHSYFVPPYLEGEGVYHYPDGRCYRGEYLDDRPDGLGTEIAADGTILYDGHWSAGEFVDDAENFQEDLSSVNL